MPPDPQFADLLTSPGCCIPATELRAISLDQLHEIIKHVTSRIEGGEEWIVGRYPLGEYTEYQIKTVDEVIRQVTC